MSAVHVKRYKVSSFGSILWTDPRSNTRTTLRAGTVIGDGQLTPSQIKEFVSSGYLVEINQPILEQPDFRPEGGVVVGGPIRDLDVDGQGALRPIGDPAPMISVASEGVEVAGSRTKATAETAPEPPKPGRFAFSPVELAGLSLKQLNALIVKTDPSMPEQQTVEAAIGILTAESAG